MKKLITSAIAIILTIITILSTDTTAFAETFSEDTSEADNEICFDEAKLGDVNNDGKTNAADARLLVRCSSHLEAPTDYIITYGDYNKDGKITAADARTALRVAASVETIYCILNGHNTADYIILPTCTKEGFTTQKCIRCCYTDGSKTDIVSPSAHKLVNTTTKATCTKDGIFKSVCSVCGYVAEKKTAQSALGHSFSVWKISGNTKTRHCLICGHKETSKNIKTIYLTFDDGPGPYTKKLLQYLKEYNVKATFFVTNQNPNYKYLLSEMVKDGHAIGVHTLTHSWSIYSSKESYIKDFNAMHKIIKDETGIDTKIFRFPGGTNNTVSRSYSRGIMSTLSKTMKDMGYIYFDWDVDCGDTSGYSSSRIAQTTINQIKGRKTAIVLMHDIKSRTVEAVKTIIEYGLDNGYDFAVIDESTPPVQFRPVN